MQGLFGMTNNINPSYVVLRSGQPRAYADSEYVVEVYLDEGLTKQQASDLIESMNIGYSCEEYYDPFSETLSYLYESRPGVWEFKMTSMYTG